MARTALVISGGAPNATLIAGALEAFHELGVKIDVISAAGAGALLGLMYIAPKNGDVVSTLRGLKEMGIADSIYQAFPVNFKVFHKPGPMADTYRQALSANPFLQLMQQWPATNIWAQTIKDTAALAFASASPSNLSKDSLGLCAHMPFAEEIIDFNLVQQQDGPDFWINAYNLSQRKMENWPRQQIDLLHLQAALSFPYLYPPSEIDGDFYIEGAAIDCLNFKDLRKNYPDLKEIIVFDLLGAEKLLRKPKDLYDAWVMSIITPLVEIARNDIKIFEILHSDGVFLHKVPLIDEINDEDLPDVFDWSRSNMEKLHQTGYKVAKEYAINELNHLF